MTEFLLFISFLFLPAHAFATSKIYVIRHATVQIESPGWCSAQEAYNYRVQYNIRPVEIFEAENVLKKIDKPETIDTVFCSPQFRAIQTAELLFNKRVNLKINENLMELDYPVIRWPLIKLPARFWLTTSLVAWMAGNNKNNIPSYRQRKQNLENYSDELINYAKTHGQTVIIAHGVVNRELIKILKKNGWKYERRDGYKNLSVNCLIIE